MKFSTVLLLTLLSAAVAAGQDQALLEAALAGDRAAWTNQLRSTEPDSLRDPVWRTCATPVGERANWARLGDDALWLLVHWTAPNHAYFNEQAASKPLTELRALPEPTAPETPWTEWGALLGALALMAATANAWRAFRFDATPLPEVLQPLDARLKGDLGQHGAALAVWHVWSAALSSASKSLDFSPLAPYKLSASEMEVVAAMVDGLNAEETAIRLACTPAHVYNVRSRIRGKLNLDADTQLDRHLQRLLPLRE